MSFIKLNHVHSKLKKFRSITATIILSSLATIACGQTLGSADPLWQSTNTFPTEIKAISIQADGKVIAAGYDSSSGVRTRTSLVRFNSDGGLDTSFGTDGRVTTGAGAYDSYAWDVKVSASGLIYSAGQDTDQAGNNGFSIIRYLVSGSLDTSYGTGGLTHYVPTGFDNFYFNTAISSTIAIQPDGKLLAIGAGIKAGVNTSYNLVIVRFNVNGTIDQTFGGNGQATIPLGSAAGYPTGIELSVDGSIFAVGYMGNSRPIGSAFVLKLTPAGVLDSSFGANGIAIPVTTTDTHGIDLAIQVDGKIVVAGVEWKDTDTQGSFVLRLNTNGALDPTFGSGGKSFFDLTPHADRATSVAVDSTGKILVSGRRLTGAGFADTSFLMRLTSVGILDSAYGTGGIVTPVGVESTFISVDGSDAAFTPTGRYSIQRYLSSAPPTVSIIGGNRTIADTNNINGEVVTLSAAATEGTSSISKIEWLIGSTVVATGNTTAMFLKDGANTITFRATDSSGVTATTSAAIKVNAPSTLLPRITSYSSERTTRSSEFSIGIRNSSNAIISTSKSGAAVNVTGYIFPQAKDENYDADIFIVATSSAGWFMRNLNGDFVPWNTILADLTPAYENVKLVNPLSVLMYAGNQKVRGLYRFYLGYMRADRLELIYTYSDSAIEVVAP